MYGMLGCHTCTFPCFFLFKFGHNLKSGGKSWGLEEEGQHHHELPDVTSHYLSSLGHNNGDRALDFGLQVFQRRKWKIGNPALILHKVIFKHRFLWISKITVATRCCQIYLRILFLKSHRSFIILPLHTTGYSQDHFCSYSTPSQPQNLCCILMFDFTRNMALSYSDAFKK